MSYWQGRFDQIEQAANNKSIRYIRQLEKKYQTAAKELDTQINAWYSRIAKNNEVTMTEAKRLLSRSELKEFKWTVQDYIKAGQENAIDQRWMKELENASAKFHINRLEAMKLNARHQIELAFAGGQENMFDVLADVYSDTFYRSCFEIQKGIGVGFDVSKLDSKQVSKLINKPWSVTGENFSTNIWKNKTKLINTLDQELSRMVLTGETPQKAIQNIKKTMDTSLSNAKRLVLTEQAYFTSLAQKDAYAELDVEEYEIVSTLDNRTCGDCGEFDGKHFPMNEMSPGVNAPPFHPYCRCTTCPYFDDEFTIGKRIAQDKEGNYYEVPEKMSYSEWKNSFVGSDGDKSDLTPVTSQEQLEKIINDVPVSSTVEMSANDIATDAIKESYEYRRIEKGMNVIPYDEDVKIYNNADFSGMDDKLANASAKQFAELSKEYNTTCKKITVGTLEANSAPAGTEFAYNLQTSTITFNKNVVKDYGKFEERMTKAVERGQFPKIDPSKYDDYVITHEFAHTLMDFESPLKNVMNVDTSHIKKARKEITEIHEAYKERIRTLTVAQRQTEMDAITTFDESAWVKAQKLTDELKGIKISKYADMNIDEFMAEAFAEAKLGSNPSEYSLQVLSVIDKYFKK